MVRDAAAEHDALARESGGGPSGPLELGGISDEYAARRSNLLARPLPVPPVLEPDSGPRPPIPLEDLVDAGVLTVSEPPPTFATSGGDVPLLSAKDVRLGRAPSRRGSGDAPGAVTVRSGDVLVAISADSSVRVCALDGVLLGPGIQLVRVDPARVDPRFLAGVLRAAVEAVGGGPIDLYQVGIPRVRLPAQRGYGAAFEQLTALEDACQRQRATVEQLVRNGFAGLSQGRLRPVHDAG
ncbi:hypothetical protein [Nocardia seriolae]|nr:hypothetical protein [Nocardia seriolae]APA97282.1 hypothetical protein NS506_03229 [Nocardia seriolae]MTJ62198.1 hypothetical protein [Nocardia seriolae]MTJ74567.1 hypothetical protein [Nocardia seriolae]MTJ87108.1 hypothetical protein [Nocardia seriolae]MTK31102.1 hypothetical protein [Nocardia seriolae]